ncbi:hypothetical protein JEQ12_005393 [Ovis aries]|uniref:UPAR/Ly6 domain-containing protein n=1 Tax=Ovis aries TaxID=9940 RepID=A0A836A412_SHEEP|nr:hypothetical protein JEQ12_005393 [Ovis aries]
MFFTAAVCNYSELYKRFVPNCTRANGTIIKNGSCVAPGDCREAVYSLTYGPGLSLWIHTACCEDNCSSVTPQDELDAVQKFCHDFGSLREISKGPQRKLKCEQKSEDQDPPQTLKGCATPEICHLQANTTLGPEASGFHLITKPECGCVTPTTQPGPYRVRSTCFTCSDLHHCNPLPCTEDRSHCLQTVGITGGRNLSVRGCGTRDLCQEEGFPALPGHRLAGQPVCNARQRAILDPKCHSGAALGLRLALPVLTVALGTATLS